MQLNLLLNGKILTAFKIVLLLTNCTNEAIVLVGFMQNRDIQGYVERARYCEGDVSAGWLEDTCKHLHLYVEISVLHMSE